MNERIRELMGKTLDSEFSHTWDTMTYEGLLQFSEKFAELIVKECIKEIGYKSVELLDIDFYPHYQERLKNYFGVER
jgi:hypothetical protein